METSRRTGDVDEHRSAQPLLGELGGQCCIYLEEKSYNQAILLFQSLLSSTASADLSVPASIPSPNILSLLATLTVHPTTTTRAATTDSRLASTLALRYLYDLLDIVGPLGAHISRAFSFGTSSAAEAGTSIVRKLNRRQLLLREEEARTPNSKQSRSATDSPQISETEQDPWADTFVSNTLAHNGSIFKRAEGFWAAVGWAFNCSVRHRHRWHAWQAWLTLMIDALEHDWVQRTKAAASLNDDMIAQSLIMKFISERAGGGFGKGGCRFILRAIFADGFPAALKEFPEVWKGETKKLKTDEEKIREEQERRKRKLNLDEGQFGDYYDDADEDELSHALGARSPEAGHALKKKQRRAKEPSINIKDIPLPVAEEDDAADMAQGPAGSVDAAGGMHALVLRRRLVALLISVLSATPAFHVTAEDIVELAADLIRPLPLAVFLAWISPATDSPPASAAPTVLSDGTANMLLAKLLLPLAPARSAAAVKSVTPPQEELQAHLLSQAAAAAASVDCVKAALLVEGMLRSTWRAGLLAPGRGLSEALERGREARRTKMPWAKQAGRALTNREHEINGWLNTAEQRMRLVVDAVETPHPLDHR